MRRPTPGARPLLGVEIAVIAFLLLAYDRITALVGVQVPEAIARGAAILRVERAWHVAPEAALNTALASHRLLGQALSVYYDVAHASVTVGVLAALYLWRPQGYRRARRAIVGVNLVALVVFWLVPIAPPRLLGAGFVDVVASSGTWGSWESDPALSTHTDAYAATPSLHVAWATWVLLAVVAATRHRLLRALAATHLLLTVTIVVATGNHYLVDVAAGAALTVGVWAAVAWAPARVMATRQLAIRRQEGSRLETSP